MLKVNPCCDCRCLMKWNDLKCKWLRSRGLWGDGQGCYLDVNVIGALMQALLELRLSRLSGRWLGVLRVAVSWLFCVVQHCSRANEPSPDRDSLLALREGLAFRIWSMWPVE